MTINNTMLQVKDLSSEQLHKLLDSEGFKQMRDDLQSPSRYGVRDHYPKKYWEEFDRRLGELAKEFKK